MMMSQKYTHEFQCSFDLNDYPFDRQVNQHTYCHLLRPSKGCTSRLSAYDLLFNIECILVYTRTHVSGMFHIHESGKPGQGDNETDSKETENVSRS